MPIGFRTLVEAAGIRAEEFKTGNSLAPADAVMNNRLIDVIQTRIECLAWIRTGIESVRRFIAGPPGLELSRWPTTSEIERCKLRENYWRQGGLYAWPKS